jgi:TatD DNase family protein
MESPRIRPDAGDFFWADSHCHLDMAEFDPDREEVIARARAAGVGAILIPVDIAAESSLRTALALTSIHGEISAAAGLHPHQAAAAGPGHWDALRDLAANRKIRAIGEIGLDHHYRFAPPGTQLDVFRTQLALASESGLPVIVHSREAGRDILAAVDSEAYKGAGVLHCFTEDWAFARAMLDRGFYVSFSGILTFPNAQSLRDVAARIPLDRLLVETDAPYLAPVPYRGRRNEPAFVIETARFLAGLLKIGPDALAAATSANFERLFHSR